MIRVLAVMVFIVMAVSPFSFSDEIRVPFAIYVEDYKAEAKTLGLDLYDNRDSHGFIEKKGGSFVVYTYKRATNEQLEIIKNLTWKHLRKR